MVSVKKRSHCCQLTCEDDALFTLWNPLTHPETATESCLKHVLELKGDKEEVYLLGNEHSLDEQVYGGQDPISLDNPYLVTMCEKHPWRAWPHINDENDDCAGPGITLIESLGVLKYFHDEYGSELVNLR